ncbi:50S ribosomal protein L15 [Pseudobythopirellula maris]|uniref:Large ribosomal subunit protein uL15 n=1 Tax=Pseudobythopirellula maris TaxID=2527991 RepID=A0A5C5ZLQ5_9BACT|nr:50S ribosomal protein L15 [Pseudobythopirellula maris]TWT88105.1 50S ribosomal protein L15 [Pseudobythopirellula maris]
MILNDVNRGIRKNKKRKRLGRGPGSGQGKTAGRGHKGQGSRAGHSVSPVFEGGRTPIVMKVPKRGFNNRFGVTVAVVNLGQIDAAFEAGDEVTLEALAKKNLSRGKFDLLKILGDGELTKKLKISAHRFSKSAAEKIEKAGAEMVVVAGKVPVEDKKRAARAAKREAKSAAAK